ncbi:cyclic GMP-binding protein C-like [Amphiura filiformis]|uniref:cyclic GMP-binding protein C-like n=1 Tax=Amphiura filiformis TaxID=82378 RepID=UPI003B21227D
MAPVVPSILKRVAATMQDVEQSTVTVVAELAQSKIGFHPQFQISRHLSNHISIFGIILQQSNVNKNIDVKVTQSEASKDPESCILAIKVPSEPAPDDQENTPAEIPEHIRKAEEQSVDLEVTFWDFAGQYLYYSTHQVFFNRRAFFALVFDMSKKLEDQCEVRDFSSEEEKSRFHDFNGEDYMKFWLQSIYTYAAQDSADKGSDGKRYPPIFIIGTHKRESTVEAKDMEKDIFSILRGKQYEKYVRRPFHFLENDPAKKQESDDKAFKDLQKAVAEAAIMAPHVKEKYPIKWLKFHKAVIEILGTSGNKPYMTLAEAKALAAKCDITDESQFTTMLGLYHDLGTIIWFEDDKILRNTVILDPQWLIDVFKAVITVSPDQDRDPEFCDKWQELQNKGILRNELIDHMLKDWIGIKEQLLELMEKFDLLFRRPAHDEKTAEKDPGYCVPACLHPRELKGHEDITDGKFYVEFDQFLPDGFFHRVLVHFARWSSQHTGVAPALLYRFCKSVVGRANNRHWCSLQMIQSSKHNSACIKVTMKKVAKYGEESGSTDKPEADVCTRVFEFMEEQLDGLRKKWAKGIKYKMTVCCVACRENEPRNLHLIPVGNCKTGAYFCSNAEKDIPAKLLYWKAESGEFSLYLNYGVI